MTAVSYLLYGYHLGDLNSGDWHDKEAAAHTDNGVVTWEEKFSWLLDPSAEDDGGDFPNLVAKKALEAWYPPQKIAEVPYPWSYLQEKKDLTVVRVGWEEEQDMVLCAFPYARTTDNDPVQEVSDLFMSAEMTANLHKAYRALRLSTPDDGPRWLLATLSGY